MFAGLILGGKLLLSRKPNAEKFGTNQKILRKYFFVKSFVSSEID